MLISLTGLLSFQAFWISNVFNQTKTEIETDIETALSDASRGLMITKLRQISGVRIVPPNSNEPSTRDIAYFGGDSVTAQISLGESASINVIRQDSTDRIVTLSGQNSSFQIRDGNLEIKSPDSLLNTNPNSSKSNSFEVSQSDFQFMDSVLTHRLRKLGLEKNYFLGYGSERDKKFTYTNQSTMEGVAPDSVSWYSVSSFTLGNSRTNSLFLKFPDKRVVRASLADIDTIVIASIIMIFLLVSAWFYTIRSLRKQHQMAQIKDDFISNMTHELKTPVTASSLALEVMEKNSHVDTDHALKELVQVARHEQNRILGIIESILDSTTVNKNSKEALKVINLCSALESAIKPFKISITQTQGDIEITGCEEEISVLGEDVHLQNAIANILDNAIKYSEAPQIDINLKKERKFVKLSISDQGEGISTKDQKRIFERFFRVHTGNVHTVKGYGLGLSYTKEIVESYGGSITVESDGIRGTKFITKLPLANER